MDDLAKLAAHLCDTPVAWVSLAGPEEAGSRVLARSGESTVPVDDGFCAETRRMGAFLQVPDVKADARFADRAAGFYAGTPLIDAGGTVLGTLAVLDRHPRRLTPAQEQALQMLARQAVLIFELQAAEKARRAGREKLQAIFAAEPACVKLLGPGATLHEMNATGLRFVEADSLESIAGRPLLPLVMPEYREAVSTMLAAVAQGERRTVQFCIDGLKGTRRWLEMTGVPFHDEVSGEDFTMCVSHDITAQKAAEEEKRLLAGRLSVTLESLADAFFIVDAEWRFTYVNHEAEQLLGRPRAQLIGADFAEFVEETVRRECAWAVRQNRAVQFEAPYPGKRWYDVRAYPSSQGLAVYLRDVTDAHGAREALLLSEERFQLLARATNDAVWDWDIATNALWWGEGFEILFGFRRDEVETDLSSWTNRIHPEDRPRAEGNFLATAEKGSVFAEEYRFLRKDGSYAYVLDRGHVIRDAEGRAVRMIGGMTDLTARRQAEQQIARFNRALKMLSTCNEALIRATDEMQLIEEICRLIVEIGGYRMAWVGYARDDKQHSIEPMAHAGEELGYLSEIHLSWDAANPTGQGPAGQAIRSGHAEICEDIDGDSNTVYWHEAARQRGYRAVLSLPLMQHGRAFGLINLYAAEVQHRGTEEFKLLQELADNLAFGIVNLRIEKEGQRVQAALSKVAAAVSAGRSAEFFEDLARNMVEALGAEGGVVTEWLPGEPKVGRTIAVVRDGQLVENFEQTAANTPCEQMLAAGEYLVVDKLGEKFPALPTSLEGVEGYAGQRLDNAAGEAVGALVVLFREPIENPEFVASTLRIFAARAAAELDRQRADARLREQAALIDEARDAIMLRDLNHCVLFWNKGAERLFKWTAEEVKGRQFRDLLKADANRAAAAEETVMRTEGWSGELHKVAKDGTRLVLDCRWTLLRDAQGQPKSILAIETDITERKKIEQQFLRAQRMESIGTLAGGIAHDLNNVLGPIIMSIELMKMRFPDRESQELLAIVATSAQHGADMVKQVLSFARGVSGERIEVQVRHLVKDIEKIVNETFLKHIEVRTIIPRDLWTVVGDPTQLHQVLLNLCVNARDAMPKGGTLTLSAENVALDAQYAGLDLEAKPGPYVSIQTEDSGTGMPPEIVDKIFDPFFTTKDVGKGTGLGLSTSAAIVKSHGGFIRVYSEVGQGTTFRVYLPAQTEPSPSAAAAAAAEMPRGDGECVLVVDDEPAVRQVTQQTLEAFGYRVILAADGADAVAIFASRHQDIAVVLTDMMMPVMDGLATIQILQKINPQVKIIGASGLTANGNVARAASLGVKHFLPKPFTTEALLKMLRKILTETP